MSEYMITTATLQKGFRAISTAMSKNRDYLVELDAQNGDGDLGVSMDTGYKAVVASFHDDKELDLGRFMLKTSKVFNEASPSSLGTITSFGFMGMAKALKGKESATLSALASSMQAGLSLIMEKAGAKPGEKTILDALCPGVATLLEAADAGDDIKTALQKAANAATFGSESTKQMRSVHGRAAYYGDKSIGILDGGSVVGRLIFESLAQSACDASSN
ncbi:dihydroxyacetone kinase subunit L [Lachnospiraceae bacterium ZAX-1]